MTLKHQYNDRGNHRIVELDVAGFLKAAGDWCGYQNIATFTVNKNVYLAVTDYFSGGDLEKDTIYQLSKTDFKSETHIEKYP